MVRLVLYKTNNTSDLRRLKNTATIKQSKPFISLTTCLICIVEHLQIHEPIALKIATPLQGLQNIILSATRYDNAENKERA